MISLKEIISGKEGAADDEIGGSFFVIQADLGIGKTGVFVYNEISYQRRRNSK